MLDLAIFSSLIRQAFNRRETDKEKVFQKAMAFLVSYMTNRCKRRPLEARYNLARALHLLGMNTHAQALY